jgi:hypothetical protein
LLSFPFWISADMIFTFSMYSPWIISNTVKRKRIAHFHNITTYFKTTCQILFLSRIDKKYIKKWTELQCHYVWVYCTMCHLHNSQMLILAPNQDQIKGQASQAAVWGTNLQGVLKHHWN